MTKTFLLILALFASYASCQQSAVDGSATATTSKVSGQRVFFCGHSFHAFVAKPCGSLAREAGIADHALAGEQYLGGSRTIQHWNLPDDRNKLKQVLATGNVDVVTLAPHLEMPDAGIDNYANLAIQHNPRVRVLLQLSWAPHDWQILGGIKSEQRDQFTRADIDQRLRQTGLDYLKRMRAQAEALNAKHGREFVFIVPCGEAVYRLREAIAESKAPGIRRQSELFTDSLGHATPPLRELVTYCWYAAIYHRSPEGLNAFVKPGDDTSRQQHKLMQQIAWESVLAEPYSGVKAK